MVMLKISRTDLRSHASRYGAHGSQKRQGTIRGLDGFISDSDDLAFHQGFGEALVGGKM